MYLDFNGNNFTAKRECFTPDCRVLKGLQSLTQNPRQGNAGRLDTDRRGQLVGSVSGCAPLPPSLCARAERSDPPAHDTQDKRPAPPLSLPPRRSPPPRRATNAPRHLLLK